MPLFIDSYDNFTYNIMQHFVELGQSVEVHHSDDITSGAIAVLEPRYLIIGPGLCTPKEAGISTAAIRHFVGKLPAAGVYLSHQAIDEVFGGNIVRMQILMHGKVSPVFHHGKGMFKNPPDLVICTRYHSLAIDRATLPECLEITPQIENNEIMGVRHKNYAVEDVQFHSEALLVEYGHDMLHNFLEGSKDFKAV